MDIQLIETPEAFELDAWRSLSSAYPYRSIFSTPEWNRIWWESFGEGKNLFVLIFKDPKPVGIVPLMLDKTEKGVRIRFVGGDDLTDYLGPIWADERYVPEMADGLARFLWEEIGGWSYFEAKGMPVPFGFAEWLVEAADRIGLDFEIDQNEVTSVILLPKSFEEYVSTLDGKRRHELRRKIRRFDNEAPEAHVRTATTQTLASDLKLFIESHRLSEGEKGSFMRPQREGFFHRIAETFLELGMLSLDFLSSGERVLATTISFRFESTFYLYNSAFDRSASAISPGLILLANLIERSISEGLSAFDFLRGPERYKHDLGGQPIPLHSVLLSHPRAGG